MTVDDPNSDNKSLTDSDSFGSHGAGPDLVEPKVVEPEIVFLDGTTGSQTALPKSRFGKVTAIISWLFFIGVAGTLFVLPYLQPKVVDKEAANDFELSTIEFQSKVTFGMAEMSQDRDQQLQLYEDSEPVPSSSVRTRLAYAILGGEIDGPVEAQRQLEEIETRFAEREEVLSDSEVALVESLEKLYGDYEIELWNAPSLDETEKESLTSELGWVGKLALHPKMGPDDEARSELVSQAYWAAGGAAFGAAAFLTAAGAGGIVGLILAVQLFMGKLSSALVRKTINGNIYIETFAIWFGLFVGLSLLVQLTFAEQFPMLANLFVPIGSLACLGWPIIRRVPFNQLRQEIGLTFHRPLREIFWGGVCYIGTIPLLFVGIVISMIMSFASKLIPGMENFAEEHAASHPIQEWLTQGDWGIIVMTLIVACVLAPITEEIMFRGILYRHLRDASAKARIVVSVIIATLVNSFVFAAIHPQGIFGIPMLMSLAIGFSLAREWRGSLVAPITMHAINNFAVTMIVIIMFSIS